MKAETHQAITRLALERFLDQDETKLRKALKKRRFQNQLLWGTKDEDGISPSRILNWHFYPANDTVSKEVELPLLPISIKPTSEKILSRRQGQVERSIKGGASDWLFSNMGRVLHHIQDMSTPSHVIPIYHGPKLEDPFEAYLISHWQPLSGKLTGNNQIIAAAPNSTTDDDFSTLYHKAARRFQERNMTVGWIFPVQLNAAGDQANFDDFWGNYDPETEPCADVPFDVKGFGCFGPLGTAFGQANTLERDGRALSITPKVYAEVAQFFVAHALADTLRALNRLDRLVNDCFTNRPFINERNPFLDDDY